MPFDLAYNSRTDSQLMQRIVHEVTDIAGVEVKYLALDEVLLSGQLLQEGNIFRGEAPLLTFREPIIMKGVMTKSVEAAKVWEAMGFFSNDAGSIVFPKERFIATVGRLPLAHDRVIVTYNGTPFEVTETLDVPPDDIYRIFMIEVRIKKLVEGLEDVQLLGSMASGVEFAGQEDTGGYSVTGAVERMTQATETSGAIESEFADPSLGGDTGLGHSDDIFGGW